MLDFYARSAHNEAMNASLDTAFAAFAEAALAFEQAQLAWSAAQQAALVNFAQGKTQAVGASSLATAAGVSSVGYL